jgi:hypothetical protein
MERLNGDKQFPNPNGWETHVWYLEGSSYNVEVLSPGGHPLHLYGPGKAVLGPLTKHTLEKVLAQVSQLQPTDSDREAADKIFEGCANQINISKERDS